MKFKCQHGERECRNNKLISCALNLIGNNQDKQVEFVTCVAYPVSSSSHKSYKECAEVVDLNFEDVEACANGELGTKLQLELEKESKVVEECGHIPTLTFDGEYNGKDFWEAYTGLYDVLEKKLKERENSEM